MAKKKLHPAVREYFAKVGRRGKKYGALGGKTRAANMTPEARSEAARAAATARWAKTRKP